MASTKSLNCMPDVSTKHHDDAKGLRVRQMLNEIIGALEIEISADSTAPEVALIAVNALVIATLLTGKQT